MLARVFPHSVTVACVFFPSFDWTKFSLRSCVRFLCVRSELANFNCSSLKTEAGEQGTNAKALTLSFARSKRSFSQLVYGFLCWVVMRIWCYVKITPLKLIIFFLLNTCLTDISLKWVNDLQLAITWYKNRPTGEQIAHWDIWTKASEFKFALQYGGFVPCDH